MYEKLVNSKQVLLGEEGYSSDISSPVNFLSKLFVSSNDEITGLNGGVTSFRKRASQFILLKKRCSLTSSASFKLLPNRLAGSRCKVPFSSDFAFF
eukprot:TRINITY_DN7579_c0_g1_i1.p2 TRINITY_DN7579_c0_g1~~TRINITY_DN7579_c0_g1_i1.p2  ORF type:complete len:96 (+),score=9.14 TRINITY_DN7579_c0_g1_i1:287-574(+)